MDCRRRVCIDIDEEVDDEDDERVRPPADGLLSDRSSGGGDSGIEDDDEEDVEVDRCSAVDGGASDFFRRRMPSCSCSTWLSTSASCAIDASSEASSESSSMYDALPLLLRAGACDDVPLHHRCTAWTSAHDVSSRADVVSLANESGGLTSAVASSSSAAAANATSHAARACFSACLTYERCALIFEMISVRRCVASM